ncbi:hypothetical protein TWF718_010893 [Orbilia javanica]|uniref:Uncharacterized protein n=1 Tax=Orbilia javanica TaxID=47235 RepID=A0AAN8MKQ1_9PEZI
MKQTEIAEYFGISCNSIRKLVVKAQSRGYNPEDFRTLRMEHVVESERGRKPKARPTLEQGASGAAVEEEQEEEREGEGTLLTGRIGGLILEENPTLGRADPTSRPSGN